jgi:hypothetical protein
MKTTIRGIACAAVLIALIASLHQIGNACPNCYGDPNSSMTAGMNMAIISLLGITGGVLAGFTAFFVFLRRRFRLLNDRFANRLN